MLGIAAREHCSSVLTGGRERRTGIAGGDQLRGACVAALLTVLVAWSPETQAAVETADIFVLEEPGEETSIHCLHAFVGGDEISTVSLVTPANEWFALRSLNPYTLWHREICAEASSFQFRFADASGYSLVVKFYDDTSSTLNYEIGGEFPETASIFFSGT